MRISMRAVCTLPLFAAMLPSAFAQAGTPTLSAENAPVPALFSSSRSTMISDFDAPAAPAAPASSAAITRGTPAPSGSYQGPLSRIGVGSYVSPLGLGGGVAIKLMRPFNLRVAGNFFSYSLTGTDDGANYAGNLHLRSYQASLDWFPFHGRSFHVSPGLVFHNQNHVTATGGISGGNSFTLNDVNYYSSNADPVTGSGSVAFKSMAPMFTAGWGNWVSRREHKHISFPFEAGFAHTGDATIKLNLHGSVCADSGSLYCEQIATDPSVQANIAGQVAKLQKDLQWIRFYPIISTGVAFKF